MWCEDGCREATARVSVLALTAIVSSQGQPGGLGPVIGGSALEDVVVTGCWEGLPCRTFPTFKSVPHLKVPCRVGLAAGLLDAQLTPALLQTLSSPCPAAVHHSRGCAEPERGKPRFHVTSSTRETSDFEDIASAPCSCFLLVMQELRASFLGVLGD